jgi:hypothetical protein
VVACALAATPAAPSQLRHVVAIGSFWPVCGISQVAISATDAYRALVAYGEIDPNFENKDVLLATSEDGRQLDTDGPRLVVVPGDIAGGRYVTNVNRVFLQKAPL